MMQYTMQDIIDMRVTYERYAPYFEEINVEDRLRTYITANIDPLNFQAEVTKQAAIFWQKESGSGYPLDDYEVNAEKARKARAALFAHIDLKKQQIDRNREEQRKYQQSVKSAWNAAKIASEREGRLFRKGNEYLPKG